MSATLELGKKGANARPRFKNRTWGTLRVSSTVSEEKPTYPATHPPLELVDLDGCRRGREGQPQDPSSKKLNLGHPPRQFDCGRGEAYLPELPAFLQGLKPDVLGRPFGTAEVPSPG
jgi:hypothetical protein